MKQRKKTAKSNSARRGAESAAKAKARQKAAKRKGAALLADALEFYRPIKKPVTLRLDADVIAWFKKDGRRYQTRINSALRKVMEREMGD
jgi:uncharacterized protein (DUF4415 family)